jgi:ABC-type transporter MlaC component
VSPINKLTNQTNLFGIVKMTINTKYMKYSTFILFIFLTTIVYATDKEVLPYIALDNVNVQIFSQLVLNQQEIKKSPLYMRVLVEEELVSALENRYVAYKMSKKQRKEFVNTIRYYLIKIYDFLLKQQKNQLVVL